MATGERAPMCHTEEEIREAGRRLVQEKGWKLRPERARLLAAMVRPYLSRDDTAA